MAYILVALEPPSNWYTSSNSVDATPRFDNANFEHPKILGMSQGQDLLRNLMHNDPALRCSATEAISYITKHLETLQ